MLLVQWCFWGHQVFNVGDVPRSLSANRICVAEEGGGGKQVLLDRGGYKGMDVCIMYDRLPCSCEEVIYVVYYRSHPGVGPPLSAGLGSTNAMQPMDVEYFGQACVPFPHTLKRLTLLPI